MKRHREKRYLTIVALIYATLFALRVFEWFVLRTDQTLWGEALFHKVLGIVILFIAAKRFGYSCEKIGFSKEKALANTVKGLAFGLGAFTVAYSAEIAVLASHGLFQTLTFYVSAYSAGGNVGNRTAPIFFVICVFGNIINVVMEEGFFRGFFQRMLERKYSFIVAAIIASCMFGAWHVVSPLRSYVDGTMSAAGFAASATLLVATSTLVGFKFALISKLTGSLYMAMGDHFVNNTIVNIVHVISSNGADPLQVLRISIAQSLSCIIVYAWYLRKSRKRTARRSC